MISAKGTTYVYDGLGQLRAEEESTGLRIAYEYDRFGNRARMLVTGDGDYTVAYTYDKNNRLLRDVKAVGDIVEQTSYRYNPNGNQLVKEKETISPAGTAGESLMGFDVGGSCIELREYNGFGQLEGVYIDGTSATYRYKPDGMRYQKSVDGVAETHLWNDQSVVAELDTSGNMQAKYLRGTNLIAREDDVMSRDFYLFNAHGDVVQTRNANSGGLWYYQYDAFGIEMDVEGQNKNIDPNPFRFCGEFYDRETNTIYLRARYYSPTIGRFAAEDSIRSGLNWYVYCRNNPILLIDPTGQDDFILYGPDQAADVQAMKKQLEEANPGRKVHVHEVTTTEDYVEYWNNMPTKAAGKDGNGQVQNVVVDLHGTPTSTRAPKAMNADDKRVVPINRLSRDMEIETVVLMACNTGHTDYPSNGKSKNVARRMLGYNKNIKMLIAPDGYGTVIGGLIGTKPRSFTGHFLTSFNLDDNRTHKGYMTFKNIQGEIKAKTLSSNPDQTYASITDLIGAAAKAWGKQATKSFSADPLNKWKPKY